MTDLERLCRELAAGGRIGSAISVAAGKWQDGRWREGRWFAGTTSLTGAARVVDSDTLFDLASVTKPVTALAAARLARIAGFELAQPLAKYLPELRDLPEPRARATGQTAIELLLAHRAGLVGHRALFHGLQAGQTVRRRAMLLEAAESRRDQGVLPDTAEGFAPEYSDLGYLLVGEALARVMSRPLDEALSALVLGPLGLELGSARQWARRDARAKQRSAATEQAWWRGGVVRGLVHDENAWAFSGEGTSGHAGLFGTVGGVLRLAEAVLDALAGRKGAFLTPSEMVPLVRVRPGGSLRAGFDGKSPQGSSSGVHFGPRTLGHLGFTGTSLWCDPDQQLVGVVLTNRVHPTRASEGIRSARPAIYDAIAAWAATPWAATQR